MDWDGVGKVLAKKFPLLERIMALGEGHLVVAGGAVVNALIQQKEVSDCDIFFVGVAESDIMRLLAKIMTAFEGKDNCTFFRSVHCVTVQVAQQTYQFIQRLYPFVDQVMGGFDIAAAGVGWTPERGVMATPLAAFCLTYDLVIADISRRSPTWELRLCKYYRKGLTVVFPSLPRRAEGEFGMLELNGRRQRLALRSSKSPDGEETSDYGFGKELMGPPSHASKVLLYRNMVLAARGKTQSITLHAPSFGQLLNEPRICEKGQVEAIWEERALRRRGFNLAMLRRYDRWYGADFDAFLLAKVDNRESDMRAITNRLVARILHAFEEALRESAKPLEWITKNPGAQWTSSFQPIKGDARSFYGKDYSPLLVGLPQDVAVEMYRLRKFHAGWAALPRNLYERIILHYLYPHYFMPVLQERTMLQFIVSAEMQ